MDTLNTPPETTSHLNKKSIELIAVIAIIAIAGVVFGWYAKKDNPSPAPQTPSQQTATTPVSVPQESLGSELYEKAANPIDNKIPAPVTPAPNPLENVYKNPFQ